VTRVLVCGGRDFGDAAFVMDTLNRLHAQKPIAMVIHGGALGADTAAGLWAFGRGIDNRAFPAEWTAQGRSAGPRRNQRMVNEGKPDLVVAFPGGRGTADMVRRARKAGIDVLEPRS
jgi:SLOG family YspA-like protein